MKYRLYKTSKCNRCTHRGKAEDKNYCTQYADKSPDNCSKFEALITRVMK